MDNLFVEKLKNAIRGKIIVLIDAANLEHSAKEMRVHSEDIPATMTGILIEELRWSVDYRKLKKFFVGLGTIQDIRFYSADFGSESHRKFCYFLDKELGFSLVTKPLKEYTDHTLEAPHRKANFDVEIAVDSTHMLEDFDTMILFSGDCDFEYLIRFLRGKGKTVIGFSRTGNIAKELLPVLTYYFDIADFRKEFLRIDRRKAKDPKPFDSGPRF
jgi:uncharacterized LabA/DUF88 family protein